jgi:hypothetical protein
MLLTFRVAAPLGRAKEFQVKLLENMKLTDLRIVWEMEQFLNEKTDHRWHINVIGGPEDAEITKKE